MDTSILLGKTLAEAKTLLEKNTLLCTFVKILSPREDILGQDERVIKVENKDDNTIIYYSLF